MMTLTNAQIGQLVAQFFLAGAGTLSFAILFACPRRTLPCCALVGAAGWFVYELAVLYGADAAAASLIAVIPLTLVSRLFAILLKTPVTVFLLTGIFPLVPGAGIYYTAYYFIQGENALSLANGISTFKISGYPANFLNAGQCLFAVDSTAGATWMGSHAPLSDISADKYVDFETAVMAVPQCDPDHPQMISQGPSVCVFNKSDPQEVLASWLFAQYLLTNNVQIAYSQTEGYIPVTSKAQESPAYQDYLSRCGEDNTTHYRAKIEAAQLLMRYTDCTFVTPVFNGSASLRNAAGQLIEDVNKSVRRRQTVNAEYLSSLYSDVSSLYRLDQIQASADGLGPLPGVSRALLIGLAVCWVGMGTYVLSEKLKKRRKKD